MGLINPWKTLLFHQYFTRKLLPYVIYAILPLALLHFYLYPLPSPSPPQTPNKDHFPRAEHKNANGLLDSVSLHVKEKKNGNVIQYLSSSPTKENESGNKVLPKEKGHEITPTCDFTNGEWVRDKKGPLYNGTSCATIKDEQNCLNHGRPDKGYLYWRWIPRECKLPRFDPKLFLGILEGKHLAFVGDSMARNQLESLLCMLGSFSPPNLIYSKGNDKFRRWHFSSHNVIVSVYWSPFLVKGIEKTNDGKQNYNKLFFDSIDERWGSDLDSIDMVILSIGHWYLHPAVYLDGDSELGCHTVDSINCTEVEFFNVFGKAFNTTLKAIIEKNLRIDVLVTTFSPHHFEGEWDKFGACPKTKPYMEDEKSLEGMDAKMRKAEVEEVEKAKIMLKANEDALPEVRLEALDITKLTMLRPDGHPGPYMYPNPFADGMKERVQNDCVHWCLPGPVDTWNEIMLDVMRRWHTSK